MEGRGGAIEADISGNARRRGEPIEIVGFRNLMDEATARQNAEKIGFVFGHRSIASAAAVV
jgi:hypothetical protein